jgi:segregation and condensation protein A
MSNILTLETKKIQIKIEKFEGPLDLLCHLIDKNKMDIYEINLNEITDQYIEYIKKMQEQKLAVSSEFLLMASTLLLIKSKGLLPSQDSEEEEELTEEELIRRIIEYKKYKEITKSLREMYNTYSSKIFAKKEELELPKQTLDVKYETCAIVNLYKELMEKHEVKKNINAKNIEKIAIKDTYTVTSKVKEIFRELIKKPKFVFNKIYTISRCNKEEVVTAFTGLLELSRRSKIVTEQEELFRRYNSRKKKKMWIIDDKSIRKIIVKSND